MGDVQDKHISLRRDAGGVLVLYISYMTTEEKERKIAEFRKFIEEFCGKLPDNCVVFMDSIHCDIKIDVHICVTVNITAAT